jgi:hypothetical protein
MSCTALNIMKSNSRDTHILANHSGHVVYGAFYLQSLRHRNFSLNHTRELDICLHIFRVCLSCVGKGQSLVQGALPLLTVSRADSEWRKAKRLNLKKGENGGVEEIILCTNIIQIWSTISLRIRKGSILAPTPKTVAHIHISVERAWIIR